MSNAEIDAYNFGRRVSRIAEDVQPFSLTLTFPEPFANVVEREGFARLGGHVWWYFAQRGIRDAIESDETRKR